MGRSRAWAVVEGSRHDMPFYEAITLAAGADRVELIRAEDLEIDGTASGGKHHSLKIFEVLRDLDKLSQTNKETAVDVIFFLDRDDDDYTGDLKSHSHVVYTRHSDVEAEIMANTDMTRALSSTYSLSSAQIERVGLKDAAGLLAALWSDWIALRLASAECQWSATRFSQPSHVNQPLYGRASNGAVDEICVRAARSTAGWEKALERAQNHVASSLAEGDGALLIKGKWLPQFVDWRIRQTLAAETSIIRVDNHTIVATCLLALDFQADWARHYADQLEPVFAA